MLGFATLVIFAGMSSALPPNVSVGPARTPAGSRPLARLRLRPQLMLLALAAMVPFVLLVLANVRELAQQEREAVQSHTASLAAAASERVGDHVRQVDAVLLVVSRIVSPLARDAAHNDSVLRSIKHTLAAHYNDLAVWAPNGDNIGSSRDSSGRARTNVADRKYFRDALRTPATSVGEPAISRSTGAWTVGIARPVVDAGGTVRAVVSATTRLEALSTLLTPASLPSGSVVTVLDRDGRVLARSADADRWIGANVNGSAMFEQTRGRESGSVEVPGLDGELRLTGFVHVRGLPWVVAVGVPVEAAMAPVRRTLVRSFALGALALVAALALAGWLGGLTARPLAQLTADAAAFGSGQLSHRTAVEGDNEVGTLGTAFNEMARLLEQRTAAVLTTEARARRLIDSNLIGILVSDARGAVIEANDVFLAIVGYTKRDIEEGRVTRDGLTPPEHRPLDAWAQLQLDQTGHAPPWEQEFVRRDGRRVRVLVGIAPLPGTDHQHASFVLDLSERIAAEEALRETHDTLQALIAAAPVAVLSTDASGRIQTWNPQAARLFGRDADDALGRQLPVIDASDGLLHSLDRALTGEPVADLEARTTTADGSDRDVSISAAPLRDAQGAVRGAVAFVTDIAERKIAERALEERDEQYRLVTDGIPLMIGYVDRGERYRFVNRAFADFGSRDPAEMLGRTVREVVGHAYYAQLAAQIAGALDGAAAHFEMAVNGAHGPRRLQVNYIPHRGAAGQVDGFFSIAADVTEQHAFDEQRRQGETLEAMAQFSAGIARDFEDALSAITDAAAALRRAPRSPAERERAIGEIERAADGTAALVAQLRRFGGLQLVQPVVIAVNEIVRQAESALRAALGAGTTLEPELGADAGDVYIDPAHAAQALASLGTFAASAMPNAQTIRLRTRAIALEPGGASRHHGLGVGAYTVVSLTDAGPGMADDARTRAFTPAFSSRADGPSPELAGVYGLVRQLGGQVYVDSSPGAGTTIEIWFPRVPGAPGGELRAFPETGAVRSS